MVKWFISQKYKLGRMFLRRRNSVKCIVGTDVGGKQDTEKPVGKTDLLCEKKEDLLQALSPKLILI